MPQRSIARDEIFAKICVRDPYFALDDVIELAPGTVIAALPVEQPLSHEDAPISGAEAGRHLAIMGTCAAATVSPKEGRHYYLAHQADLTRLCYDAVGPLRGRATATFEGKRSAVAKAELLGEGGRAIYALDVQFHVVPERVFEKLYASERVDMRRVSRPPGVFLPDASAPSSARTNPYRGMQLLTDVKPSGPWLTGVLDPLLPEYCKGHFPLYPALPVSILMHGLSGLAGRQLGFMLGDEDLRYSVDHAAVRADSLAFSGARVDFRARHAESTEAAHIFDCEATVGEKTVGSLRVTLSVTKRGTQGARDDAKPEDAPRARLP